MCTIIHLKTLSCTLYIQTHTHKAHPHIHMIRVVFDGGPDGEFWYQLQLSAVDPDPVTLPDIICELGK